MALAARPILEAAVVVDDLEQALAGFGFVAGTTRRHGAGRRGRVTPRQLAAELPAVTVANEVAILFGREDSGLTNDELQYCQRLVTIPSSEGFGSLNLAQSVLAIAYEIFLASETSGSGGQGALARRAPTADLEGLYSQMERVLLGIGYLDPANPSHMMRVFRRLFGRAGPDSREVKALRGIFRQVDWYVGRQCGGPTPGSESGRQRSRIDMASGAPLDSPRHCHKGDGTT